MSDYRGCRAVTSLPHLSRHLGALALREAWDVAVGGAVVAEKTFLSPAVDRLYVHVAFRSAMAWGLLFGFAGGGALAAATTALAVAFGGGLR